MFSKIKITLALLIINSGIILSQQLPFSNLYLVNRQFLSPALSGITGNIEAFVNYQKNALQFPGGPEFKSIYASGPVYGNMSLGCSVTQSSVTIFNAIAAEFDYAYHLKISEYQFIHFGLSFAFNETFIGIENNQVLAAQNDPYILRTRNSLNYGSGISYSNRGFQLGIAVPRIYETRLRSSETDASLYTLPGLIRVYSSCLFDISKALSLEPSIVIDKAESDPLWYNVSLMARIKQITYLEVHYRQGSIMGLGIGFNPSKKMIFSYSYDMSGTGIMKYSSGIHEISFGFLIGKKSENSYQKSSFRSLPKQPYYEWVK